MALNLLAPLTSNTLRQILAFWASFAIAWYAIPVIVSVSRMKRLFDHPNGRTSHLVATPTLGGISLFAALLITSLVLIRIEQLPHFQYAIAGCVVIFFIGLKDDLTNISWSRKLSGELLAAFFLIVLGDYRLTNLHGLAGIHQIGYGWSLALTLVVTVGIVNAMNLIDGIDGLAAGLSTMASACFGAWFFFDGQVELSIVCFSMTGALMAFTGFNVFGKEYKIFMGDTGSLLIGYLMTLFVIVFNESNIVYDSSWHLRDAPIISFAILFVPLYDTLRVMIGRLLRRKSPFSPDRTHIHHYLLDLGLTHIQTTLILLLLNGLFIVMIYLLQDLNINLLAVIVVVMGIAKILIPVYWGKYFQRRKERMELKLDKQLQTILDEAKKMSKP